MRTRREPCATRRGPAVRDEGLSIVVRFAVCSGADRCAGWRRARDGDRVAVMRRVLDLLTANRDGCASTREAGTRGIGHCPTLVERQEHGAPRADLVGPSRVA